MINLVAQKNDDQTLTQPDYRMKVRVPLLTPAQWTVKSKKDATVDIETDRFDRMNLVFNVQDERGCAELIKALEEARVIMKAKRKKGKKV